MGASVAERVAPALWVLFGANVGSTMTGRLVALFHTLFDALGVRLMRPLAGGLTHWLGQRLRAREEDEAKRQFLDGNVLAVPALLAAGADGQLPLAKRQPRRHSPNADGSQ